MIATEPGLAPASPAPIVAVAAAATAEAWTGFFSSPLTEDTESEPAPSATTPPDDLPL